MTSDKNHTIIDKILREGLGRESTNLDFDAWKAAHPEQVAQFRQERQAAAKAEPRPIFHIFQTRPIRLALAACLIVAAGLVLRIMPPQITPRRPDVPQPGPAAMMNRLNLTLAYAEGGIDALERQYDKAYAALGPRAGNVSVHNLLN